jgi:hypothetical protein
MVTSATNAAESVHTADVVGAAVVGAAVVGDAAAAVVGVMAGTLVGAAVVGNCVGVGVAGAPQLESKTIAHRLTNNFFICSSFAIP